MKKPFHDIKFKIASGQGNFVLGIECNQCWSIVAVSYDAGNLVPTDFWRFENKEKIPTISTFMQVISDKDAILKVLTAYNCSKIAVVTFSLKE